MDLLTFVRSGAHRAHIEAGHIRAYMRNTVRFIEGKHRQSLEIGSVELPPIYQRKGRFSRWLAVVEQIALDYRFDVTYVECVHNPHLVRYLLKCGYTHADALNPPNLYKLVPQRSHDETRTLPE